MPSPAVDNGLGPSLASKQVWYGVPRGADLNLLAGPNPFRIATDMLPLYLQDPRVGGATFRNATDNGVNGWQNLSYRDLANAAEKGTAFEPQFAYISTDNPDLKKFRDRGGKLITYVGSSDNMIPHGGIVNYYHRVGKQLGGLTAVQRFYKLYLLPGMGHFPANGTANPNANPPIYPEALNYRALTDWVERGIVPPDKIDVVASATPSNPQVNSGPMCAYPKMPAYTAGNVNAAASYSCSVPK